MMHSDLHFKLIAKNEITALRVLAFKIFRTTYQNLLDTEQIDYMLNMMYAKAVIIENMEQGCQFYWVIYQNINIGYGAISVENEMVTLHKIYIDTDYQGKKIGQKFINFLSVEGAKKGGKWIQLFVKRDNPAKYFYEKIGFKILKEVDKNIGNGYWMNDYLMEKEIRV